jgi:hypothetical protein
MALVVHPLQKFALAFKKQNNMGTSGDMTFIPSTISHFSVWRARGEALQASEPEYEAKETDTTNKPHTWSDSD